MKIKSLTSLMVLSVLTLGAADDVASYTNHPVNQVQTEKNLKTQSGSDSESNNRRLHIKEVLILLTLTGAFGGLAASLVRNEGRLICPSFNPEPGSMQNGQSTTASSPSISTTAVIVFHLGFISDVMVGIVASNSIHLALAAVLDYKTTDDNLVQKTMSLVALGLVAGFSGPKILAGLAKKLEGDVERNLRETDERQQRQLLDQQHQLKESFDRLKEMAQANVYSVMSDALRSDQPPPPERSQVDIAAKIVTREPQTHWGSNEFLIMAYKDMQEARYSQAISNAEKALQASAPEEMRWRIHNLLGYCYHWTQPKDWKRGDSPEWYEKAKEHYLAAAAAANSLAEEALSKANLCFVYLDAEEYKLCVTLAQATVSQACANQDSAKEVCDLLRIALAAGQVSLGDSAAAATALNAVRNLSAFKYLFNVSDLKAPVLSAFGQLKDLTQQATQFMQEVLRDQGLG